MEYMVENSIIDKMQPEFPKAVFVVKKSRRIEVKMSPDRLYDFAVRMQKRWNFLHLSAISCVDWIDDGEFELVYHFWNYDEKVLVMAKIRIPREEESHFDTISNLWQPAKFFERDIHEMFGIYFDGSEDMEKYILTDWNGPPPMRKDFITREFALNFYKYREYEPQWLKDMMAAGEGNE